MDIDYVGDDLRKNALQQVIEEIADAMHLDVEAVPIDEFVPSPENAQERRLFVGRFGVIDVYILDPYTIALSKIDRGFDTDLDDVCFLVQQGYIEIGQLETIVDNIASDAQTFDLDINAMQAHLAIIRQELKT